MILIPTTLTIAGAAHADTTWHASGLVVDSFGWDYDDDLTCEFHEEGPALTAASQPTYHAGQSVLLTAVSIAVFLGEVTGCDPGFTAEGWTFGYRCRGPKYLANKLYITASDFTGTMLFNLPATDDNYVPSLSGQTVGQILTAVLTQHATALTAIGITTDATTTAQLATMTVVPTDTVHCTGKLWSQVDQVLSQWARNYVSFIGADGLVRFVDTTAGLTYTLTEGTDPLEPIRFTYDLSDTATRFVVRGSGDIRPAMLKMSQTYGSGPTQHMIKWAQTSPQQAAWNETSFTQPAGAFDSGTVNSATSSTTVSLTSSNATLAEPVHFWAGVEAWVHLYNNTGTGLTFQEALPVADSTAQTAGAAFTVTTSIPLYNGAANAYLTYQLVGGAPPLGSAGANDLTDVWRLLTVNDPGGLISGHLVKKFPTIVGFIGYYGDTTIGTTVPQCVLVNAQGEISPPVDFDILPNTGQVRLLRPAVEWTTSAQNLAAGGAAVTAPSDVYLLLAYSHGPLQSVYPPDVSGSPAYSGTAYTLFGYEHTAYLDVDSWIFAGNQSLFDALAEMYQVSTRDVPFQATVPVLGALPALFSPFTAGGGGTYGYLFDLAGSGYTTGQESLAVPVRGYKLTYRAEGGVLYRSAVRLSARRNTATGDRYYVHPTTLEQSYWKSPPFEAATAWGQGGGGDAGSVVAAYTPGQAVPQSMADLGIDTDTGSVARGVASGQAENAQDVTSGLDSLGIDLAGRGG